VYSEVTSHVEKARAVTSYGYDALGRRTLAQDVTGQALRTVYDGKGFEVIREGEVFRDGSLTTRYSTGGETADRNVQPNRVTGERYRYISGGDGAAAGGEDGYAVQGGRYGSRGVTLYGNGEAVAVSYSSSATSRAMYLGKDVMGSVRTATGDGGALEDRYEYDAFGKPYTGNLDGMMNLGYTGKPYDSATGLYNYGYRDYKPQAARFTTEDPIRDGNNWFAYVNNDPVNWRDPWGLEATDGKSKWTDNGDGTYTSKLDATLWGLYGSDWQEKSGFTRDPKTLQTGETVGVKNDAPSGSPTPSVSPTTPYGNNNQNNQLGSKENDTKTINFGMGLKAAIVIGLGIEVGITFDTDGGFGVYGSFSVGTGVQVGVTGKSGNILTKISNSILGRGVGWADGSVQTGITINNTVDIGVGIAGTWDLNNLGTTGLPTNGISFGTIGGGVWQNYTGTIQIK